MGTPQAPPRNATARLVRRVDTADAGDGMRRARGGFRTLVLDVLNDVDDLEDVLEMVAWRLGHIWEAADGPSRVIDSFSRLSPFVQIHVLVRLGTCLALEVDMIEPINLLSFAWSKRDGSVRDIRLAQLDDCVFFESVFQKKHAIRNPAW